MKLFFRTLAIVMAALLAVSLVGCGGDDETETPDAAFESATPADGPLAANDSITVKFDENPGEVTVTGGGTVSTTGKTRTISPPDAGYDAGTTITITVSWTNGDGSQDLTYTIIEADTDAPTVTSSEPADGETGVSADLDEVKVTFSENVTGDLMLLDDGENKNWDQDTSGDTITLTRIAGEELSNEITYTISGTVMDGAINKTDVELTFVTEAKE